MQAAWYCRPGWRRRLARPGGNRAWGDFALTSVLGRADFSVPGGTGVCGGLSGGRLSSRLGRRRQEGLPRECRIRSRRGAAGAVLAGCGLAGEGVAGDVWAAIAIAFGFCAGVQQAWQTDGSAGHNHQNRKRPHGHPDSAVPRRRLANGAAGAAAETLCGGLSSTRHGRAGNSHRGKRDLFRFVGSFCIAATWRSALLRACAFWKRFAGSFAIAHTMMSLSGAGNWAIDFDRRLRNNVALLVQDARRRNRLQRAGAPQGARTS